MLKGDTGENLIGLLERRLDAVIYSCVVLVRFVCLIFSVSTVEVLSWFSVLKNGFHITEMRNDAHEKVPQITKCSIRYQLFILSMPGQN